MNIIMNTKTITILCVMIVAVVVGISMPQVDAVLQQDHYPIIHDWSFTDSTIGFTWYQEKINPSSQYGVYWKVWNDNAWNRDTIPSGVLTHTLTGLDNAQVYHIKIIPVVNGLDKLYPSWTDRYWTASSPVNNIQTSVVNGDTLHVTWDYPYDKPLVQFTIWVLDETHNGFDYAWDANKWGMDIPLDNYHNGDTIRIKVSASFSEHDTRVSHYITSLSGKH